MVIESEQVMYRFGKGDRFRVRSIVAGNWRLSISDREDIAELYDLESDPDENVNLWAAPEHAATRARLLEALAREMVRLTDDAPLPTALA